MTSQAISGTALTTRSNLFHKLLATNAGLAPVALRTALAITMFPHGAQKMLGWFGGHGFSGTMGFLTETMGLPSPVAFLTILLEFFGPLLLLAGLGTRAIALGLTGIMIGAIATVHWKHGLFMNWFGNQAGEGFEYHLLVIGMGLALLFGGGGRWSLDRRLSN